LYQTYRKEFLNPSFFTPYLLLLTLFLVGATTHILFQILFHVSGLDWLYLL